MDLLDKEIGSEGDVEIKLVGGKLVLVLSYEGKGGSASVSLGVTADYFLDKLAKVIPGEFDDTIIEVLKVALKTK